MARWKKLVIGGDVALIAPVAVGLWWFLRDDAPDAVSLDAAVGAVANSSGAASAAGLAGDWTVDTSVGQFSFEDSTGTFVGFRVSEDLSRIGSTTAVGRTPAVTGTMSIDGSTLTAANIEADMTALTTNNLTVHGVTKSVEIPLEAQLTGDTIVVVGSLPVMFSDYGITAPTAPIVLSVDDHGTMELQLFFTLA